MNAQTETKTIWYNINNGEMLCEKHAGCELASAIENNAKANQHTTFSGTWVKAMKSDIAEMVKSFGGACESCVFGL